MAKYFRRLTDDELDFARTFLECESAQELARMYLDALNMPAAGRSREREEWAAMAKEFTEDVER